MLPDPAILELPPEGRRLVAVAEELVRERIAPRAPFYDEEGTFPFEDYADLHKAGITAMLIPRKYGGLGVDPVTYSQVLKAVARANGSTALTLNMHSTVTTMVAALASDEQRRQIFREVVEDGALMATITSEPTSSLRGKFHLSTTAHQVDGGYTVNGIKHFCSLSEGATFYFVWACLEDHPMETGLVNLLMRRETPGITLERTWNSMAMRATSSHTLHFKDCFVPAEYMMGGPGAVLEKDLTDGFILGYAAIYLGIAEAALEHTIDYTNATAFKPDNVPISHFTTTQVHVAEMALQVDTARLMLQRAATARMGADARLRALTISQAKYLATEAATAVTDRAIRVCGGRGLLKRFALERFLRDARAGVIMPPHNDRCLEIIGRISLGLAAGGGFVNR